MSKPLPSHDEEPKVAARGDRSSRWALVDSILPRSLARAPFPIKELVVGAVAALLLMAPSVQGVFASHAYAEASSQISLERSIQIASAAEVYRARTGYYPSGDARKALGPILQHPAAADGYTIVPKGDGFVVKGRDGVSRSSDDLEARSQSSMASSGPATH